MEIKQIVEDARRSKTERYRKISFFYYNDKPIPIAEAFISLRAALEKAVSFKFGVDAFVHDFSNKEVVVGYSKSDIRGMSSWESGEYDKIPYKLKAGAVIITGLAKKVTKKTSYENLNAEDWKELCQLEGMVAATAAMKSVILARRLSAKKK